METLVKRGESEFKSSKALNNVGILNCNVEAADFAKEWLNFFSFHCVNDSIV